ncbi:MAG: stage II sporulation protein R [Clostridia bacterium]|nr:stage II sporulation protein R [Clostridia bacterium]
MKTLLNIICSKKVKYSLILIILLSIYIFISAFFYVTAVSSDLENSIFRLHVIANSDSKEDQDLKYIVRDNLIAYMNDISINANNKEEAIQIAKAHTDEFYNIAKKTIIENGYNYDVTVEIGNFDFPTKHYGDISIPAGYYDALRVKIGEAKGQNWWCVMFPPLCFVNVTSGIVPEESKELLESELNEEEYDIISNKDSSEIKLKFKLIELLQNTNILTAKK